MAAGGRNTAPSTVGERSPNQTALLRGLLGAIVLIRNDPFGDKSRKCLRVDAHVFCPLQAPERPGNGAVIVEVLPSYLFEK